MSPLMWAQQNGHYYICKVLSSNGNDGLSKIDAEALLEDSNFSFPNPFSKKERGYLPKDKAERRARKLK